MEAQRHSRWSDTTGALPVNPHPRGPLPAAPAHAASCRAAPQPERSRLLPHALRTALVEPPVNLLLLALLGLLLARTARPALRRLGRRLVALGLAGLLVLSLPVTAWLLLTALERGLDRLPPPAVAPQAIVVLSAEDLRARPGGIVAPPDLGALTLERLRAAALLHRRTGLPVLVSGGVVRPANPPIAHAMARVLAESFGIAARWVEDRSPTTWANAEESAALLRADGIASAYLVTHAWHMRRALLAFARTGLAATPAPTHFTGPAVPDPPSFVPSAKGWTDSNHALHEWVGLVWYALAR